MSKKVIADLTRDLRLSEIARNALGKDLVPFKATLFNKTSKANWLVAWHQDTALPVEAAPAANGWGAATKKQGIVFSHAPTPVLRKILALRIHCDASTSANGPLRVIPGSHRKRIVDDNELRKMVDAGPRIELTVGRGGVIAMSPLLIHASSKCRLDDPRRVLHVEYAESLDLISGVRLAIA